MGGGAYFVWALPSIVGGNWNGITPITTSLGHVPGVCGECFETSLDLSASCQYAKYLGGKQKRKRNKKVAVVMIGSPIRGTLEGAMHHGLCVTHRCRKGRHQQSRGDQAGHDHQLRYSVSHLHWRAGTGPYRTDSFAGKST